MTQTDFAFRRDLWCTARRAQTTAQRAKNLHALCVPHDFDYSVEYDEHIGLNTLKISGFRIKSAGNTLYSREKGNAVPVTIRLVPYSAFANRGESDMLVWLHAKQ